ncbi:MAG: M23 family metallopeptidase [Pseudoxanthomonas sp.]
MPRDYSRREVLDIVERQAERHRIPRDDFLRLAYIESGGSFDERAHNRDSGAAGLFQFVPSSARQYGIDGREFDPEANTEAAARLYWANHRALLGDRARDGQPYLSGQTRPNGLDMYLAHQQGAGGYDSIQDALHSGRFSRSGTRANLLGNIGARDLETLTGHRYRELAGMDDRELAGTFVRYWEAKYARVRIPEMQVEPLAREPGAAAQRHHPPATQAPAGAGHWPAPGNTRINAADKPGEGRGEFGSARSGGRRHGGVDIQGSVGDPIEAWGAGTVTVKRNNGAAGNSVTIDHGHGVVSRYFHLQDIDVHDGQRVEAGQRIGSMGRSGNLARQGDTHLHFEMHVDGRGIDPMSHLHVPGREQAQAAAARTDADGRQHPLYVQALERLGDLGPNGGFASREQFERAAAATAYEAQLAGLARIDRVVASRNGQGLFAVQDNPGNVMDLRRAYVDRRQALAQPAGNVLRELAGETGQAEQHNPAQAQAQQTPRNGPTRTA